MTTSSVEPFAINERDALGRMSREDSQSVTALAAAHSPSFFMGEILGMNADNHQHAPYDKQIELLESIRDNRRTSVVGCNSSGKDYIAGRAIVWWMNRWDHAKVIVLGPTHRQVDLIVFREARSAFNAAPTIDGYALKGRMFKTSRYEVSDDSYAEGFATNDEFNIQGFHSPHLLVIVTEAHAVEDAQINALLRLQPERILMTGNPFSTSGIFYESHHTNVDAWNTIQIAAEDTPNLQGDGVVIPGMVTEQVVEEAKRDWGEDSPMFQASIKGEFPEGLDIGVVDMQSLKEAMARETKPHGEIILGVDVARYGIDKTVVTRRQGQHARTIWETQGKATTEIVGWLSEYATIEPVDFIVVDDTGVGGGVTDQLTEMDTGAEIVPFIAGAKAMDEERYANATTEAWFAMRRWFKGDRDQSSEADIDDSELVGQLVGRQFTWQSDRRLILESKTKMAAKGRKSPDKADSLSMTFASAVSPYYTFDMDVLDDKDEDNPIMGKESMWAGRAA